MKRKRWAARGSSAWVRRGLLAVVLLGVAVVPAPGAASGPQPAACRNCRPQQANAERWAHALPGNWLAVDGATGTVPATGQAYVAVGGDVAAVAAGLTVYGYGVSDGKPLWQANLAGFPSGATIMSVRAWPGVITVGVTDPRQPARRTEVVISGADGSVLRRYPAAQFGGAVAADLTDTVIVGATAVTSYDNSTGRVLWQRPTGSVAQAWRADGDVLYVTESVGGYLGSAPVTALRRIDLNSGTEQILRSSSGSPFTGTLAGDADGVVLFTSAAGVTGYSGVTGLQLWFVPGAVPEGADAGQHRVYLTQGSSLVGVDALTGRVRASVSGSTAGGAAGMYVVRDGVDQGAGGEAWGYDIAIGRVTWTAPDLPWPHYFADLSGVGGSAGQSGSIVVITACQHLGTAPTPSTSPTPTPSASSSASPSTSASTSPSPSASTSPSATASPSQSASPPVPPTPCAAPELVALTV
jgi:hypothetical protein